VAERRNAEGHRRPDRERIARGAGQGEESLKAAKGHGSTSRMQR